MSNLSIFSRYLKLHTLLSQWLSAGGAVLAFLLCLIICADVLSRNIFDAPIHGVIEVVSFAIVIIASIQIPDVVLRKSMLKMTFLQDRLSPKQGRIISTFGYTLGAIFFLFIAIGAYGFAIESWVWEEYEGEGAIHIPAWPARFSVLISAALTCAGYIILIVSEWGSHQQSLSQNSHEGDN